MPYETLSLEGMDIDDVERSFAVLQANYGDGYQDGALVGSAAGTHRWALSSGCLPDDDDISPISAQSRFTYYWNFYQARMAEANGVFILEFRGANYHAAFEETRISMERFTNDLFGGGVTIVQRRVRGFTYAADGSIPA